MDARSHDRPAATLRFGFAETALGTVLAANSDRGLAALLLGDHQDRLQRDLRGSFPDAELIEDRPALAATLAEVSRLVASPRTTSSLMLDLRGTALELAVWHALRAIPAGETRNYGQVAKSLDTVATAQEVGAACAANLLAIVVPCHRVIKADGSLAGYRWGVSRKRQLLQWEGAR